MRAVASVETTTDKSPAFFLTFMKAGDQTRRKDKSRVYQNCTSGKTMLFAVKLNET